MRFTSPKPLILAFAFAGLASASNICDAQLADTNAGPLKVGMASADITPEEPVWMAGFSARKEMSRGVYKDLTATCLVFDNGRCTMTLRIIP